MLANGSKPYPERSHCTLLQEAVFTPLAGCGAYHQEVAPFLSCEATEWPRLQGGYISGRLRPTHLFAQVDDSKTMGYVLTGRLLFRSQCIWALSTDIWCILGGEAIQLVLLDQCQCADFAIELATSADVNWCQLITFRSDRRLLVNEQAAGTMSQWHWMILVYNF